MDCSKAIRPSERLLDFSNDKIAHNTLLDKMEVAIVPKITSHLRQNVLGAFLMVAVPGMKKIEESPILIQNGRHFKGYTPFRVSSMVVASNERAGEKHPFVKWVYDRLRSAQGPFGFIERPKETLLGE